MTTKTRAFLCILALLLVVTAGLALAGCKKEPEPTPGPSVTPDSGAVGVYYYDAGHDEYTLTLHADATFDLIVKAQSVKGTYTLVDGTLTLDFSEEGKENATASLAEGVVTLTYEGATMRLLKKINYTVSFEANGGSATQAVTVVNGKSPAKPADPAREGHVFVGWYTDSAFNTPFVFGAQPITADTVLYARWSAASGNAEYTARFDLNYEGAPAPTLRASTGGKLFDLPTATREGYTFHGWWYSFDNDGSKLSYRYEEGTALSGNVTLLALWLSEQSGAQLTAPVVNVESGAISWNAVSGARSYAVRVLDADGAVVFEQNTGNTTVNVDFGAMAAGVFEIRVTAFATAGDANNSEAVRYYHNKALDKVSVFTVVEPWVLNFNTVAHAEKYLITVACGNPDHVHTAFDNGTSRSFSFVGCTMPAEGIRFTVTAVARGYASSTSEVFVYQKTLPAIEELRYDEVTQTVVWNEVPGAAQYMVSVNCGDAAHAHGFVSCGTQTFVSLKGCDPARITVKVYPVAKGYASPVAAELVCNKTALRTPTDLQVVGSVLSWSAIAGVSEYEVRVGDDVRKVTENSFDLAALLTWVEGSAYPISVRALGQSPSAWSDTVTARYLDLTGTLSYANGMLSWSPVIGADFCELQINGGEVIALDAGVSSLAVTLDRAGYNTFRVRFAQGASYSEWESVTVFAHTVIFDPRGGSDVAVQYKAVGDLLTLPVPTKTGYDFAGWYNLPGGPLSNGLAYTDGLFAESGSIVLYAYYTPTEVEITYNYGLGGSGDKTADKVRYENHYQLTVPVPGVATGAFGGWFSAPYGMGVQYTDAKGQSLAPWTSLESVELHAFWIDYALEFTLTKINGVDVYTVSAGERIALLEEVTVPATFNGLPVAEVAGNAFKGCTNLKAIHLPDTIRQVSLVDPFAGCTALQAIHVYATEGNSTVRYWSRDGVLFDNGTEATAAPRLVMMPLGKTGTYRIPHGVAEIPANAFANSALSKIVIPASVTSIGKEAFLNCYFLTSVVFETAAGEQPLTISARAFSGCAMLERITLPARLAEIPLSKYVLSGSVVNLDAAENAFAGCVSLVSINVAAGNKSYKSVDGVLYSADGRTLLYCPATLAGAFSVPTGTQTVAPGAFIGCKQITEVFLPNSVTSVGEMAFFGLDTALTKLTFGGNGFQDVTVGKYAFYNCNKLSEIVFESGSRVSVLEEGSFYNCTSLSAFKIPASMTQIGRRAFSNCTGLESIEFASGGKPLAFGDGAFSGCWSLTEVSLPANVSEIPGVFSGCANLQSVTVDKDSPYFTGKEGVLFNKDMTEVVFFPQGKTGEYALPQGVTSIAPGVFSYVSLLSKLILPNTLTSIGEEAFLYCAVPTIVFEGESYGESLAIGNNAFEHTQISELILPAHTKSLGDYAFAASKISHLTLNQGLESIGAYAFSLTYDLFDLDIPGSVKSIGDYCFNASLVQNVTLHEGLESIGKHAFENSYYINSVTIPASVKVIDDYAFSGAWLYTLSFAENSCLETIGAYAFNGTQIATLSLPNTVSAIGAYAFRNCTALASVSFAPGGTTDLVLGTPYRHTYKDPYTDATVTEIQTGHVFDGAVALRTVTFPPRLTQLGEYCFYKAGSVGTGLTVEFGAGSRLQTIGAYCFYDSALTAITIPRSVTNLDPVVQDENGRTFDRIGIGAYAFAHSGTGKLASVTFQGGGTAPLTIGESAFQNAKMTSVTLPARISPYTSHTGEQIAGLANGAGVFSGVSVLGSVMIEDGGAHYDDRDGVVYTADFKELIFCPVGKVGAVTLPATLEKIHDKAFFGCSGVSAITFAKGENDLSIGDSAFEGCAGIKELALPDTVVSLGASAFCSCTSLETLTIPKSVTNFDSSMIENCPSLKSLSVESGDGGYHYDNGALYSADKTTLILYPANRTESTYTLLPTTLVIAENAFAGNTHLQTVILPQGLREIGASAFSGCTALSAIEIPSTVTTVGKNAFAQCVGLQKLSFAQGGNEALTVGEGAFFGSGVIKVTLPARVSALGNEAFRSSRLIEITFAENARLERIGDRVFAGTWLTDVTFPEGLIVIGASTFEQTPIVSVTFPASLVEMGVNTFKECKSLQSVSFAENGKLAKLPAGTFYASSLPAITIPASVQLIESKQEGNYYSYGVFEGCTALERVTFAGTSRCMEIGQLAFYGCSALSEFNVPASVSTIGYLAFYGCTSLESVTLPVTVTRIGHSLFSGCTALESVTLNTMTTELPTRMFYNCKALTTLEIPANVTTLGDDCFTGSGVETFTVAAGSGAYCAVDGVLYSADRTRLLLFPPQRKAASITIPKEVTEIGPGTFSEQYWLERVVFEQGGTAPLTIGDYAFAYCYALHTVVLPERLAEIGTYAFQNCSSLMQLTIPENVEKIGSFAFYYCRKLIEIYNLSALEIVAGGEDNGYVGYYAYNVYTPDQGSSIVNVDANGFVTATLTKRDALTQEMVTYKYLIGYTGEATNLVLPTDFEAFFEYAFYRQNGIVSIFVPAGAGEKAMGSNVFASSGKPVLIMGYTACPETWGAAWNSDNCPVIWGGEDRETTYTFVTNSEQTLDAMTAVGAIVLPALDPVAGKVFVGWFDNAQGEGEAITGSFYSAENVTLYAIWRDKSDIGGDGPADLTGSDFEHAIDLTLGTAQSVAVNANRKHVYLKLVPTADGEYRIYVTGGYAVLQIYAGDTLLGETVYAGFSDIIDGKIALSAEETYYFVLTTVTGKGNLRVTVEEFVEEPGPGEGGEEPGPGTGGGSNPGEGEHVPVTEGGTGFADAIDINLGTIYDISIDTSGKKVYFQYTAPAAGVYHVKVTGSADAVVQTWKIADENKDPSNLHQSNQYANWTTGMIDTDLKEFEAGHTYYIVIYLSWGTGDVSFTFTAT